MLNVDVGLGQYSSREEFCIVSRKYEMKCLWSLCILDQLLKEKQLVQKIETVSWKNVNFWDNLQNQFRWNIGSGGRIFWSSVCHSGFALSWVLVQVAPPPLYIPQIFIYLTRLVHLGVFCTSIYSVYSPKYSFISQFVNLKIAFTWLAQSSLHKCNQNWRSYIWYYLDTNWLLFCENYLASRQEDS